MNSDFRAMDNDYPPQQSGQWRNEPDPPVDALQRVRFRNILVIDMGTLADVVLSVPALRALRTNFPEALLTVVTGSVQGEVLRLAGLADRLVTLDHQGLKQDNPLLSGLRMTQTLAQIGLRQFDVAVDLNSFRETGWLTWASGAKERLGLRHPKGKFEFHYTARLQSDSQTKHLADHYADVVEALGIQILDRHPRLPIQPGADAVIEKRLKHAGFKPGELLVGLYPGSTTGGKLWPVERFAEIGARLAVNYNARVGVLDRTRKSARVQRVVAQIRTVSQHQAVGLSGLSMVEMLAAMARCTLVICADVGMAQLSAAVDTPTLVLTQNAPGVFRTSLRGARHRWVSKPDLNDIVPDEIYELACEMLQTNRTGALFER
ncbi:MAG: glycosyltransferase family 9 protein [Blastocatellia bacterium]|nr:glycosyltransferase family 9 protein [Blastocatellia bacterium]